MADKKEKLSSKEKKEWLDYLDWKIENEKSMQTWSGISIWILIGLIGFFGDRILSLISIYGLDDLLSLNSLYLLTCFLLVSFVIFDISKTTIYPKFRSFNEEGNILFMFIVEFLLYFVFCLFLYYYFNKNIYIFIFAHLSIFFALRLVLSANERSITKKNLKNYKRLLKLQILSPTLNLLFGIALYILAGKVIYDILKIIQINQYTTFNNGADLLGFSAYLYLCVISILVLFSLLFRKYTVKRLVAYRDKLFFDKVETEKIKEYIINAFHGADFEEYADKEMKLYDEKIAELKSKLSALEEKAINGKLKPNEILENYIQTKELRQEQHDLILKSIRLNGRKYVEPFSPTRNKELRSLGLSLCDDAIDIETKIKKLNKKISKAKATLN